MGIRSWLVGRLAGSLPLPEQVGAGLRLLGHQAYNVDPLTNVGEQMQQYRGWPYAAITMIASDVSRMPWVVLRKRGKSKEDWEEVDAEDLPGLFSRVSSDLTFNELLHLTQVHKDLTGKSYWHLVRRSPLSSEIAGIQVLNPDWFDRIVFSNDNQAIQKWKFNLPGRTPVDIDDEDVIFHRYLDARDRYTGASPTRAFALAQDVDMYTRAYMASFSRNRGTPEGLLTSDQELTPEHADTLRQRFKDVFQANHEVMVLGKGAKFEKMGASIKDLDAGELFRPQRDQILSTYNVPASRLGMQEDANRASGEEADRVYHQNCLAPRLAPIANQINIRVLERVGLDPSQYVFEFVQPDFSDQEAKRLRADTAFNNASLTVNEYREELGYSPIEGVHGSLYKVAPGTQFVEDPSKVAPPSAPNPPDEDDEENEEDENSLSLGAIPLAAKLEIAKLAFVNVQSSAERSLKTDLRRILSAEQKAMIRAYNNDELSIRVLSSSDVFDDEAWNALLEKHEFNSYQSGWELFAQDSSGIGIDFALQNDQAVNFARARAGAAVTDIKKTTLSKLQEVIATGIEEGRSNHEIAKSIEELYNGWKGARAEMISRTEVSAALNGGKDAHAERFNLENPDVVMTKTWLPTQDERTRDSHTAASVAALNGGSRTLRMNQKYRIGNSLMARPHDPNGAAGEIINCRCVLVYDG